MTIAFQTTDELLTLFDFGAQSSYHDPVVFKDSKVGFSIKRNYPDNIRYKPALKKDKTPNNVVTIWVGYTHPQETKKEIDLNKVPIRIRVANMNLYRTKHFDYDFNDKENCPTEDSVTRSNSTPKPIELEYNNEFFYSHKDKLFLDESGNKLSGIDILDRAYSDHCDTVHPFKGLKLRLKLLAQSNGSELLSLSITFLKFLLKVIFGRTLEDEDSFSALYNGYKIGSLKKLNEDSLNVFGYKAAKPVIIVFCAIVILISLVRYLYGISGGYLSYISSNNTSSISHGIFTLWLLDAVAPYTIFFLINGLIKLRSAIIFRSFKWR